MPFPYVGLKGALHEILPGTPRVGYANKAAVSVDAVDERRD